MNTWWLHKALGPPQYKLGAPRVLVQDEQPDQAVNGIWEAFLDAASRMVQDGQLLYL